MREQEASRRSGVQLPAAICASTRRGQRERNGKGEGPCVWFSRTPRDSQPNAPPRSKRAPSALLSRGLADLSAEICLDASVRVCVWCLNISCSHCRSSVAANCGRETKTKPWPPHRFSARRTASAKINWWTLTAPHRDSRLSASPTHTYDRVFFSYQREWKFFSCAPVPCQCRARELCCKILLLLLWCGRRLLRKPSPAPRLSRESCRATALRCKILGV